MHRGFPAVTPGQKLSALRAWEMRDTMKNLRRNLAVGRAWEMHLRRWSPWAGTGGGEHWQQQHPNQANAAGPAGSQARQL